MRQALYRREGVGLSEGFMFLMGQKEGVWVIERGYGSYIGCVTRGS